jgi:hypothetical protein
MRAFSPARPASLARAAAIALAFAGPAALAAQQGPCARDPGELARAVMSVRAPAGFSPAQQQLYGGVVTELRAGNTAAASSQFRALIRSNPALARGAGLCTLLDAAVRQGTLEADPRALARMRALANAAQRARDDSQLANLDLQRLSQDLQREVSTIATIQRTLHDSAMAVLENLKS